MKILFFYLGGLCSIFRRQAGNLFSDNIDGDNDDTAEIDKNSFNYCHNSHWLNSDSDLSKYVGYYDATSLYPSSGKYDFWTP